MEILSHLVVGQRTILSRFQPLISSWHHPRRSFLSANSRIAYTCTPSNTEKNHENFQRDSILSATVSCTKWCSTAVPLNSKWTSEHFSTPVFPSGGTATPSYVCSENASTVTRNSMSKLQLGKEDISGNLARDYSRRERRNCRENNCKQRARRSKKLGLPSTEIISGLESENSPNPGYLECPSYPTPALSNRASEHDSYVEREVHTVGC